MKSIFKTLIILMMVGVSQSIIISATTYNLKFGEDLRSVALKYGINEGVLNDLNLNAPQRFAFKANPAEEILNSNGMVIRLPDKAKMLKKWDKDLELAIYLENMRLLFSDDVICQSAIEDISMAKKIYIPYVNRLKNDFGFKLYTPVIGETLSVIGLRYENALPLFESLNPALSNYMFKHFKYIGRNNYTDNVKQLEALSRLPVVMPLNIKEGLDPYPSYKLWSLNLTPGLEKRLNDRKYKKWEDIYVKKHGGSYAKSCLLSRLSYSKIRAFLYGDYPSFKFELERLAESENDGSLATMETDVEYMLDYYYKIAIEESNRQEAEDRAKRERRKQRWRAIGMGLIQGLAGTASAFANAYYGGMSYNNMYWTPVFNSTMIMNNVNNNGYLNFSNSNAGLNAAIIMSNSSSRINSNWNQFQNSMMNMRPYTFEDLQSMNLNSFNSQLGLNFSQEQYDQAMTNWSSQGASGSALGGVSLPAKPTLSESDNRWKDYYQTSYTRWEQHAMSTFNSLTTIGTQYTSKDGDIRGSVGDRGNIGNSTVQLKMNFYDIQKQMRNIRNEAAAKGINISQSQWEDAVIK